jgi:hypothetical protein
MNDRTSVPDVSLLGGPLHRMGRRLGLVRGGSDTRLLGLAIGWLGWAALLALAVVEGVAPELFAIQHIGSHLRLLFVIPLFFVAESWLEPVARIFVRSIVSTRLVPESEQPTLATHVERLRWWTDGWWLDALCFTGAALMWVTGGRLLTYGSTAVFEPAHAIFGGTLTGLLYFSVAITIFRFLVFRWCCRLVLWAVFLWRVSRLRLHLVPIHPDRAGGLGGLELVQSMLLPLVAALSVIGAASNAEELSRQEMTFAAVYPSVMMLVMVDLVLIYAPLFPFTPGLFACRRRGFLEYMELASRYVNAFEEKWIRSRPADEPLIGTPDLQSLADLTSSVEIARDMRLVPAGPRLLLGVAAAAGLPILPLLLFQYPLAELIQTFLGRLVGL